MKDAPLYNPSYDNRNMPSTFKMQIRTVQRLRARLNASDDPLEVVKQKSPPGRPEEFIEKVQTFIDETLQQPILQIVRDFGVSHTTVNTCVKEDLKCRPHRNQTSQNLTEKTKNLRLIKFILPRPEPAGLLHMVIRREHPRHDLIQH